MHVNRDDTVVLTADEYDDLKTAFDEAEYCKNSGINRMEKSCN